MKKTLFPRVLGQARADAMLGGFLDSGRVPSALLFLGPQGVGKLLAAVEFARALLCRDRAPGSPSCGRCSDCVSIDKRNHPDLSIVDARYQAGVLEEDVAKQRILKVDTIRHLRKDMDMHSMLGSWKVAIVEDAGSLNEEASNALLKILEEPLPQRLWILIAAQKERLPKTVPSRCFTVPFSPLPPSVVGEILAKEGLDRSYAETLADLCEGSVSRARALAERGLPDSLKGALGPIKAAESLPKDLASQRREVETALFSLAQAVRRRHLKGEVPFARVQRPLQELARLRLALRANADPRGILTLACLETEGL